MIFGIFTLAVALTISAVAAYYSIAGLCAIFAAAVTPIIIMGASLEAGKIVATVWLHRFWHRAPIQFKLYLIPAIVILMLVTSMGIFGFLSKAHMDQTVTVGDSSAKVSILDEKIATEKTNIDSAKRALQQMDAQVDQLLGRTTDDKGANRAVQVRKQQAQERKNLQREITEAQKHIAELQNERAPLAAQTRKIEAEVGPIKYIAALIYGDNPDANLLERAVRWVIILLVFVFDPLALVLILAAEQTIEWAREDRSRKKPDEKGLNITLPADDTEPTNFFKRGKEIAQAIDNNDGHWPKGWHQEWVPDTETWPKYEPDDGPLSKEQIQEVQQQANVDLGKVITTSSLFDNEESVDSRFDPQPIRGFQPPADDDAPINPPPKPVVITDAPHTVDIPDFSINAEAQPVNANFGTEFPVNPQKGDMFLRVDYLPNRVYKWNGQKWIELNNESSEQYAYDEEYIKHLIERIDRGEYDVELLSDLEQEQIQRYLNEQSTRK